MSSVEKEGESISLTDQPAADQDEPIEQVMNQETGDSGLTESSESSSIESEEDQDRFEETAKFEEEVEHRPSNTKRKATRRKATAKADSKLISSLDDKLRKYSDASKKTDMTIREIERKIKDLDKKTNAKHHQMIRDMQREVKELQRKIDRIERSTRSTKFTAAKKKTVGRKNKNRNKKSIKKESARRSPRHKI
jgi:hypothetical protein